MPPSRNGCAVFADAAVKHHRIILEIEFLTDAGAETLFPRRAVQNTALHGGGKAVCGVNPVVAVIEVFAKELPVAEAAFRRIEIGQVVLGFGRNIVVEQARLEVCRTSPPNIRVFRSKVAPLSMLTMGRVRLTRRASWLPKRLRL